MNLTNEKVDKGGAATPEGAKGAARTRSISGRC